MHRLAALAALPAALVLAAAGEASASAYAGSFWGVGYHFGVEPGLVPTYSDQFPLGGVHKIEIGDASTSIDTFTGGPESGGAGKVEWDATANSGPLAGFAGLAIYGPLGDTQGPRPLAVFSNPTSIALQLVISLSDFSLLSTQADSPLDFARAAGSYSVLGGTIGAATPLDQWSGVCDTRLGCFGDHWTHSNVAPLDVAIQPGASYAVWIDDATALTQAVTAPEPATWLLMLGGFGFLGAVLRRSGRAAGSAAAGSQPEPAPGGGETGDHSLYAAVS